MRSVSELAPYIVSAVVAGGIGVGLSGRRDLVPRWCAWAVAVPVLLGAFLLGAPGIAALVAVVAVVCVAEYARLARLPVADRAVVTAVVVGLVGVSWLAPARSPWCLAVGALAVALVPLLAGDAEHGFLRVARSILGVAWFAPLAAVVPLGPQALALFVAVSLSDIAAYFGGRRLRGPRLSPLSPAKRCSGVLVGAVAGLGTLAVLGALTLPLSVGVVVGGPLGDLFESMVKRGSGVKDTGTWLPGSGGVLDRVDSTLFALALATLVAAH